DLQSCYSSSGRHTSFSRDWSSDVCSSDLVPAILAGCKAYYGYPITPASEIAETAAKLFPLAGGTFLQAESEIGAINMTYGAASTDRKSVVEGKSVQL